MAISNEQQSSRMEHRQIKSRTFDQLVEVHVAAEAAEIAGEQRKLLWRCNSHAAEHRPQWNFVVFQLLGGLREPRYSGRNVKGPLAAKPWHVLLLREVAGAQGGRRDARTAERGVPVQTYSR